MHVFLLAFALLLARSSLLAQVDSHFRSTLLSPSRRSLASPVCTRVALDLIRLDWVCVYRYKAPLLNKRPKKDYHFTVFLFSLSCSATASRDFSITTTASRCNRRCLLLLLLMLLLLLLCLNLLLLQYLL